MNTESVLGPGIFAPAPRGGEVEDVEAVTRFLQRYQNLKDAHTWRDVENFKQAFSSLHPVIQSMLNDAEEQNRLQAASFNVFRVLHLEAKEDEVHTTFLADLLNPKGAHGQKHLFLHAFLDAMLNSHGNFPPPEKSIEQHTWFVESQKYIGEGTLDIVVSCPALSYLIVIENKIYAGEQEDQLARYARWMNSNREWYTWQALIYLTPTGEASATADTATYYPASYRGQIAGMLKAALPDISAPHLRETILQYLEVIQNI